MVGEGLQHSSPICPSLYNKSNFWLWGDKQKPKFLEVEQTRLDWKKTQDTRICWIVLSTWSQMGQTARCGWPLLASCPPSSICLGLLTKLRIYILRHQWFLNALSWCKPNWSDQVPENPKLVGLKHYAEEKIQPANHIVSIPQSLQLSGPPWYQTPICN
jgi:hypothetical protein